jgi:para-aminobenzoate synthetase component 1
VLEAQRRIRAGEAFQVNLSHRLEVASDADAATLYARLRAANPAPYLALFASGPLPEGARPFDVVSSSPELLFRLCADGTLQAKPIAGTRPRGSTPAEDERLRAELVASGKENAEHVMLVDLARNDLGRVASFGTVRVAKLLDVESYATVHHLVSTVEARLAPGRDAIDALVALFPGGTVTGAPKVRAMEIIEELEPLRRGAYTGSLVWAAPDGSATASILIRTLVARGGRVHAQVGAGIVDESVPAREWDETLAKARGMLRALGATPP